MTTEWWKVSAAFSTDSSIRIKRRICRPEARAPCPPRKTKRTGKPDVPGTHGWQRTGHSPPAAYKHQGYVERKRIPCERALPNDHHSQTAHVRDLLWRSSLDLIADETTPTAPSVVLPDSATWRTALCELERHKFRLLWREVSWNPPTLVPVKPGWNNTDALLRR